MAGMIGMNFRFTDEVGWAFKIFDIDNSGCIVVQEIDESVKVSNRNIIYDIVKTATKSDKKILTLGTCKELGAVS